MIFACANAVPCPCKYPAPLETALKWLADHDLPNMEAGTYEVQGKDLYIMIQDFTTQPAGERRPERHDDYLDLQYIVSGVERMGYVPYTGKETVDEDPEGKDVTFYKDLEGELLRFLLQRHSPPRLCRRGAVRRAQGGGEDEAEPAIS